MWNLGALTTHTVKNPHKLLTPQNLTTYSHPLVTAGHWFWDSPERPKCSSQPSTCALFHVYNTWNPVFLSVNLQTYFSDQFLWAVRWLDSNRQATSSYPKLLCKVQIKEARLLWKEILKRKNKVGRGSSCRFSWVSLNIILFLPSWWLWYKNLGKPRGYMKPFV